MPLRLRSRSRTRPPDSGKQGIKPPKKPRAPGRYCVPAPRGPSKPVPFPCRQEGAAPADSEVNGTLCRGLIAHSQLLIAKCGASITILAMDHSRGKLSGKTALITGAAVRLGRAMALAFADAG